MESSSRDFESFRILGRAVHMKLLGHCIAVANFFFSGHICHNNHHQSKSLRSQFHCLVSELLSTILVVRSTAVGGHWIGHLTSHCSVALTTAPSHLHPSPSWFNVYSSTCHEKTNMCACSSLQQAIQATSHQYGMKTQCFWSDRDFSQSKWERRLYLVWKFLSTCLPGLFGFHLDWR